MLKKTPHDWYRITTSSKLSSLSLILVLNCFRRIVNKQICDFLNFYAFNLKSNRQLKSLFNLQYGDSASSNSLVKGGVYEFRCGRKIKMTDRLIDTPFGRKCSLIEVDVKKIFYMKSVKHFYSVTVCFSRKIEYFVHLYAEQSQIDILQLTILFVVEIFQYITIFCYYFVIKLKVKIRRLKLYALTFSQNAKSLLSFCIIRLYPIKFFRFLSQTIPNK